VAIPLAEHCRLLVARLNVDRSARPHPKDTDCRAAPLLGGPNRQASSVVREKLLLVVTSVRESYLSSR